MEYFIYDLSEPVACLRRQFGQPMSVDMERNASAGKGYP